MSKRFSHLLTQHLQDNPKAWENWEKEKKGRYVVKGNLNELTEKIIQTCQTYIQSENKNISTEIRRAVQNVEDRKWTKKKQVWLETEYMWDRYKTEQILGGIFAQSVISLVRYTDTPLLEEPKEHKEARESYMMWIEIIGARVFASLGGGAELISDDAEDNSPFPPCSH